MKTIRQFQRAGVRLAHWASHAGHQLRKKGLTEKEFKTHTARLVACGQGVRLLKQELLNRNIDKPAKRCAFPKRIQRKRGLLPAVSA